MLAELQSKGFDIVTVNIGDDAATVKKFWHEKGLNLRVLMDPTGKVAERYKVMGIPCNYLIGNNGKVIARFAGFDETLLRQTLAKAGIQ